MDAELIVCFSWLAKGTVGDEIEEKREELKLEPRIKLLLPNIMTLLRVTANWLSRFRDRLLACL